jgi:hypothetical protein
MRAVGGVCADLRVAGRHDNRTAAESVQLTPAVSAYLPSPLSRSRAAIQFGLAGQQFLKTRRVFERPPRLLLKIPSIFSARASRTRSSATALSRLRAPITP